MARDTIIPRLIQQPQIFVRVLTEYLQKWARLYSFDRRDAIVVTEEIYALYGAVLADLSPERLDAACRRASETCKYFPKPADIRAQLDLADVGALELEAEKSWQNVLEGIHWSTPRRFSGATEHAIRAANGLRFIERCSEEQLAWCHKEFLKAYKNVYETQRNEYLLSAGEARRRLAEVELTARKLAATIPLEGSESVPKPSPPEVQTVLQAVWNKKLSPVSEPCREELERRWNEQKKRLNERLQQRENVVAISPKF
jgi:hypothetical protein